jgi:hypothetical protein
LCKHNQPDHISNYVIFCCSVLSEMPIMCIFYRDIDGSNLYTLVWNLSFHCNHVLGNSLVSGDSLLPVPGYNRFHATLSMGRWTERVFHETDKASVRILLFYECHGHPSIFSYSSGALRERNDSDVLKKVSIDRAEILPCASHVYWNPFVPLFPEDFNFGEGLYGIH